MISQNMNELGKRIIVEQDSDESIKLLAAQKEIYKRGKGIYAFQMILAVPIPIVISLVTPLIVNSDQNVMWLFAFYSILATFIEFFCEDNAMRLKKLAASIQEKFDIQVLDIPWNKTLIPRKPTNELIYRYYSKHIKNNRLDNLYGWYSKEILPIDSNIATLLCQRTNCSYDFALRERYSKAIGLFAIGTFLILFVIAGQFKITLPQFISNVFFPSLPVFVLAFKQISRNNESIDNLRELNELIGSELEIRRFNDIIDDNLIRQIQDKIYLKRINSPLLPEWAYKLLRQNLEEEMHFSIRQKIVELRKQ